MISESFLLLNNDIHSEQFLNSLVEKSESLIAKDKVVESQKMKIQMSNYNNVYHDGEITLIFNGFLYNYKDLHEFLGEPVPEIVEYKRKIPLQEGETEEKPSIKDYDRISRQGEELKIVIQLYKKYGIEHTLHILEGVFSLVIIDYNSHNDHAYLYVARDTFGVQPFYMVSNLDVSGGATTSSPIYGFSTEYKTLAKFQELEGYTIKPIEAGTYSKFSLSYKVHSSWELETSEKKFHLLGTSNMLNVVLNDTEKEFLYRNICHDMVLSVNKLTYFIMKNAANLAFTLHGGYNGLLSAFVIVYCSANKMPMPKTYNIRLEGVELGEDVMHPRKVADFFQAAHKELIVSSKDYFSAIEHVIRKIESYDKERVRKGVADYLISDFIASDTYNEDSIRDVFVFQDTGANEWIGKQGEENVDILEWDKQIREQLAHIDVPTKLLERKRTATNGSVIPLFPFLDKRLVQYYLSASPSIRQKHNLLMEAFAEFNKNLSSCDFDVLWDTNIIDKWMTELLPAEITEEGYYKQIWEDIIH